ncbi:MAG: hypothetical protein HMLKMBBP_02086 [Planctomycetes bacterium]|nr:hypothetical protein [Planctomycetota bacterium]
MGSAFTSTLPCQACQAGQLSLLHFSVGRTHPRSRANGVSFHFYTSSSAGRVLAPVHRRRRGASAPACLRVLHVFLSLAARLTIGCRGIPRRSLIGRRRRRRGTPPPPAGRHVAVRREEGPDEADSSQTVSPRPRRTACPPGRPSIVHFRFVRDVPRAAGGASTAAGPMGPGRGPPDGATSWDEGFLAHLRDAPRFFTSDWFGTLRALRKTLRPRPGRRAQDADRPTARPDAARSSSGSRLEARGSPIVGFPVRNDQERTVSPREDPPTIRRGAPSTT